MDNDKPRPSSPFSVEDLILPSDEYRAAKSNMKKHRSSIIEENKNPLISNKGKRDFLSDTRQSFLCLNPSNDLFPVCSKQTTKPRFSLPPDSCSLLTVQGKPK